MTSSTALPLTDVYYLTFGSGGICSGNRCAIAKVMNDDRRETINGILSKAAEVPEAERPAFLKEACAGNPELLDELEQLLA